MTPGLQPDCSASEAVSAAGGTFVETAIPSCAGVTAGSTKACWELVTDPATCSGGWLLRVNRPGGPAAPDTVVTLSCATCPPGILDPGCFS
jgi:hypothetical protein